MRTYTLIGLAAGLIGGVSAACSSALKIDDFSKWSSNTNSLNSYTSDDGTMSSISASGGVLSFKPKSTSYFYETFSCQAATTNGYNSIQFTITGAASSSLTLEIQTQASCSATTYTSYYYTVSGLTASSKTVTVPLSSFTGANVNAITAFLWSGFSSTTATWKLSNIQFGCASGSTSSSVAVSSSSSSRAASSSSTRVSSSSSIVVSSSSTSTRASSAASSPTGKASTDGTCGGTAKYTCLGTSYGNCCSQYGWCGSGTTYCGTGCQSAFGTCSGSSSSAVGSSSSSAAVSSSALSSSRVSSSSSSSSVSSSSFSSSVSSSSSSSSSASSSSSVRTSSSSSVASSTTSSASSTLTTMITATSPTGTCSPLLIDDFTSQSRLTFLFYNAMLEPSSDDASMKSVVVGTPSKNRVTLTPSSTSSYWYSEFGCVNAKNFYGGISLRIKAAAGTTFSVELDSSSTCDPTAANAYTVTSAQLGWTFDGTEKLYTIPFSKFSGLDTSKLVTILFSGFNKAVSFGPMAFYCGSTGTEYIVTTTTAVAGPSSTVAAPTGTAAALTVDKFGNADSNALGFWHGGDDGITLTYASSKLTIKSTDPDLAFYTQVSGSCSDITKYEGSYLHIKYTGSTAFTISLQQHNSQCSDTVSPFPETWDSAEASRYANNGDIYVPINHFNINLTRAVGFAFKGFYTTDPVTFSLIEIVPSVPAGWIVPNKLETGDLVFACKRPNSFAFAIDDGSPEYAQEILSVIREENIKVTFFTVGAPLLDESTNLTNVYREMQAAGHQIALHSYTHPKMEGLPDYASIDWEYNQDIATVEKQLNGLHTPYFRPPFGTEGARMRERLAIALGQKPTVTMWSVDVEDWLWAETDTPEEQLTSFQRDVNAGGNLVVMHYLYPTTVSYLKQFITIAKATGKQLMRVDQCMMDPNAPPLD